MSTKFKNYKKKPFNKSQIKDGIQKKYGSVQEGRGFALLQKKKIESQYGKVKKKLEAKVENEVNKNKEIDNKFGTAEEREAFEELPTKKVKKSKFQRAKLEFEENRTKKQGIYLEKQKRREEIEQKRKMQKIKKFEKFKKLNRKTKFGQPDMKSRMGLLLEEIQAKTKK